MIEETNNNNQLWTSSVVSRGVSREKTTFEEFFGAWSSRNPEKQRNPEVTQKLSENLTLGNPELQILF